MNNRTFYATLAFFIICLVGVALAIVEINERVPESEEGALMQNTCEEITAYETIRAEQDLDELAGIINDHINEYSVEVHEILAITLQEIDSLRDEVAFHNTRQEMYRAHFRKILNQISFAELSLAADLLKSDKPDQAMTSVRHAQHCLHDALFFTEKNEFDQQAEFLHQLNVEKNNSLTVAGLQKLANSLK